MHRPNTLLLNKSGSDPFPFFNDAWTMYCKKGMKTVFISIGTSKSAIADLEIAETVGCPIIVVPGSEEGLAGWIEVAECIKMHEALKNPKSDFSKGADENWILPKNLRLETTNFPFWNHSALFKISDTYSLESVPFYKWVEAQCKTLGLHPEETRIDILKIDMQNGNERGILYSVLDAGFRPSTLLIHWSTSPDTDMPTRMVAGHLQNCGYILIRKEANKFLYYFIDSDMYSICSWENTSVINPLINELIDQLKAAAEPTIEQSINNVSTNIEG